MTVMDHPQVAPSEKLFAAAIPDIGLLPQLAGAKSGADGEYIRSIARLVVANCCPLVPAKLASSMPHR